MSIPNGLIFCPACRRGTLAADASGARCGACDAAWPSFDGVLDLLPAPQARRSIALAMLETESFVRFYESRFWRRNPLVVVPFGIGFARELDLILTESRLPVDGAVLDLACGPGIYTRAFARRLSAGTVVGLDLSRPMLSMAARLAREENLANVTFVRANAQDLPFETQRFHAVNCCGALHLFPDVSRALAEARRVLKPGGRLTVAAVRVPAWPLAETHRKLAYWASGIRPFTVEGMQELLRGAGLDDLRIAHAKRAWLVASAANPG